MKHYLKIGITFAVSVVLLGSMSLLGAGAQGLDTQSANSAGKEASSRPEASGTSIPTSANSITEKEKIILDNFMVKVKAKGMSFNNTERYKKLLSSLIEQLSKIQKEYTGNTRILGIISYLDNALKTTLLTLQNPNVSDSSNTGSINSSLIKSLDENEKKWNTLNLKNYSFEYVFGGMIVKSSTIKVQDGVLLPSSASNNFTIGDVFKNLRTMLLKNPSKATITYNSQYGFPEKIFIDHNTMMADEETYISIKNFVSFASQSCPQASPPLAPTGCKYVVSGSEMINGCSRPILVLKSNDGGVCTGSIPSSSNTSGTGVAAVEKWEKKGFITYGNQKQCSGDRLVGYSQKYDKWVGAELCETASVYKLYMSATKDGTYYQIGDNNGHGQDHCELINNSFTIINDDDINSGSCKNCSTNEMIDVQNEPIYSRSKYGESFMKTQAGAWGDLTSKKYSCGTSINNGITNSTGSQSQTPTALITSPLTVEITPTTQVTISGTANGTKAINISLLSTMNSNSLDVNAPVVNNKWIVSYVAGNVLPGTYSIIVREITNTTTLTKGLILTKGTLVIKEKVTISQQDAVAFGVYEGGCGTSTHKECPVYLEIPTSAKNKVLVLTAYEPVKWILRNPNKVTLSKIIAIGYYNQNVVFDSSSSGPSIEKHSYTSDKIYGYAYSSNNDSFKSLVEILKKKNIILTASNFIGSYSAKDNKIFSEPVTIQGTTTTPIKVKWGPQSNTPFNAGKSEAAYSIDNKTCYSWTTIECGSSNIQTSGGKCVSGSRYSTDYKSFACPVSTSAR